MVAPSKMTSAAIPLANFLLSNCNYVSEPALLGLAEPSEPQNAPMNTEARECPICFTLLASAEQRAIQIDMRACRHIFCSDCLSRHILAGYNTCPLCRTKWFDIPAGATTGRNAESAAEIRVEHLEGFIGELMHAMSELTPDDAQMMTAENINTANETLRNFMAAEGIEVTDSEDSEDSDRESVHDYGSR